MKLSNKLMIALVPTLFSLNALSQASGVVDQPLPSAPVVEQPKVKKTTEEIQATFDKRIERGEKNGALTVKEKARLEKRIDNLNKMEEKFNADGVISEAEQKKIDKRTKAVSKEIYKEKHDGQDRVNGAQHNQDKRIDGGEKSGQLTKGEKKQLRQDQLTIKRMEGVARSDGKVTQKEFKMIRKEQKRASARIYKMKHNERQAASVPKQ